MAYAMAGTAIKACRGKIFISYRREDEQGFAVRLYERLAEHLGKKASSST